MDKLSHFDEEGLPKMVDISGKHATQRIAVAEAELLLTQEHGAALNSLPKGDPFTTAKLAGIQAAKRCADLIPLCHQVPLSQVDVRFEVGDNSIKIFALAKTDAATGVEMEAYSAVAVAGLTLIDMLKGVSPDLTLTNLRLLSKTGGKENFERQSPPSDYSCEY
jgi:cyclic pyranopterin phosphate synthase